MKNASEQPDISVIIPVFNGEKTLPYCLDALFRESGVEFEVIVVDDGSTDASASVAGRYPVKLIRLPGNTGGGPARNPGADLAIAPILLHTDADVEVLPGTLARIVEEFKRRPELDALFGAYSTDCPQKNFFSQYKNLHHHYIHWQSSGETQSFWSGCGAARRQVFLEAGGFGDREFLYDLELGYRMAESGYRIAIVPEIQVRHHKEYRFFSLLKSDVLGRAIPWVQIMLDRRKINFGLNTRSTDKASVILVWLCLLLLASAIAIPVLIFPAAAGLVFVILLNWRWSRFCFREKGLLFACQATLMELLFFAYCGIGVIWGVSAWILNRAVLRRGGNSHKG